MKYSVREDIKNIDRIVEHLWIEVNGKNKNNSLLGALFHQPSSIEKVKEAWMEKVYNILGIASAKWNGQMIVSGDFNINLLSKIQITDFNILRNQ